MKTMREEWKQNRDKERKLCKNVAQNAGEKRLSSYLLPQTFCIKRTVTLF